MIKKTRRGHQVVSKRGKPLSKAGLSRKAAVKRLAQVEYFKGKGPGRKDETRR